MISLAVIVCLIFLVLLLIGPISYVLSFSGYIPKFIQYILATLCILIGIWACFIPVPLFRLLGFVNCCIGIKIFLAKKEKTTQA